MYFKFVINRFFKTSDYILDRPIILTRVAVVQPEQQGHQGGFPRAAGSHHGHDGARGDQQAEVLEDRGLSAGRVGKGDLGELQPPFQLVCREHETL